MNKITNTKKTVQRIINAKAKEAKVGIDEHARDVVVSIKLDSSQAMRARARRAQARAHHGFGSAPGKPY